MIWFQVLNLEFEELTHREMTDGIALG